MLRPLTASEKICNVQVPLIFKNVIDALNIEMTSESTVWILAGSLILACKCSYDMDIHYSQLYRIS